MKHIALGSTAFASAAIAASVAAYLAHTVLGMPRAAIRIDALGLAACLTAFIGTGLFVQWRDK
jgi:hypothetical protein